MIAGEHLCSRALAQGLDKSGNSLESIRLALAPGRLQISRCAFHAHWDRSVILRQATSPTLLPISFNSVTRKIISKSGNGLPRGSPNMLRVIDTESFCNRNCPAISVADIDN